MAVQFQSFVISSEDTFRVRIKLDSEETVRRLRRLPKKLGFSRKYIIYLIQKVDKDGDLRNELIFAERQIVSTVELLETAEVNEREYLAEAVLDIEAVFRRLKQLLMLLDKCLEVWGHAQPGCYLRASYLIQELRSKKMCFQKLRDAFKREFAGLPQRCPGVLGWVAYQLHSAAEWFHVSHGQDTTTWHRDNPHTYPGRCVCKEYV
jgi:hypothetical protein